MSLQSEGSTEDGPMAEGEREREEREESENLPKHKCERRGGGGGGGKRGPHARALERFGGGDGRVAWGLEQPTSGFFVRGRVPPRRLSGQKYLIVLAKGLIVNYRFRSYGPEWQSLESPRRKFVANARQKCHPANPD